MGKINIVLQRHVWVTAYSFATLPNAFRQCTISLLIIHSAITKGQGKTPRSLKYLDWLNYKFESSCRTNVQIASKKLRTKKNERNRCVSYRPQLSG